MLTITKKQNQYTVKNGDEYANFIIDEGETSIKVVIDSSYGAFSHYWNSTGKNPRDFLNHINIDYTLGKFGLKHTILDENKQREIFLNDLEKYATENNLEQEEIEDLTIEIDELVGNMIYNDGEHNLFELHNNGALEKLYDTDDLVNMQIASRINPSVAFFWEELWKPFTKYLVEEKEKNNNQDFYIGDLVEINDDKHLGVRLFVTGKHENFFQLSHILNDTSKEHLIELPSNKINKVKI